MVRIDSALVAIGAGVTVGHTHRTETDTSDVKVTQFDVLHGGLLRSLVVVEQTTVAPEMGVPVETGSDRASLVERRARTLAVWTHAKRSATFSVSWLSARYAWTSRLDHVRSQSACRRIAS